MNEHLEKAKRALDAARDMDIDLESVTLPTRYIRLLDLATVQATVAQAEAMTRLADVIERAEPWDIYKKKYES